MPKIKQFNHTHSYWFSRFSKNSYRSYMTKVNFEPAKFRQIIDSIKYTKHVDGLLTAIHLAITLRQQINRKWLTTKYLQHRIFNLMNLFTLTVSVIKTIFFLFF